MPGKKHAATTDLVEYASSNPAATRKFLEGVLGFKFEVEEEMGYSMRSDDFEGGAGTGIRAVDPEEPGPATFSYLTVEDLETTIKAAEKAGAKVLHPKTEIPDIGWSCVLLAPGGVVLGLFQELSVE